MGDLPILEQHDVHLTASPQTQRYAPAVAHVQPDNVNVRGCLPHNLDTVFAPAAQT